MNSQTKPKIVAIVGPTSSGKTSVSIEIAKKYGGEVISADSRQVYKGMDIGTGKVTKEEMEEIPHHLLDIASPLQPYTASDFLNDATDSVFDILSRNKLPIVAGGTFFYLDLLRGKCGTAPVEPDYELRDELEKLPTDELLEKLRALDANRAEKIDPNNRRRLIRSIEIASKLGLVPEETVEESKYDWLVIGLRVDNEILHQKIHKRLLERLDGGMVSEVEKLLQSGVTHDRLEDFGLEYRYVSRFLREEMTYEAMVVELETKIRQFAKRQMTWLKRDDEIVWCDPQNQEAIFEKVEQFLKS